MPSAADLEKLYSWLRYELRDLPWNDYSPKERAGFFQHPALPNRMTYAGRKACTRCGHGFKYAKNADAHIASTECHGAELFDSDVMLISRNICVPVVHSDLYSQRFQPLAPMNDSLAKAMHGADGSNMVPDVATLLPKPSFLGPSQVTQQGTDRRPAYLEALNWFAILDKQTAQSVVAFCDAERSPEEALLHSTAKDFFRSVVAPSASSAPLAHRAQVNHAFQLGGTARLKLFKPCTPDTHERYASVIADALLFCYRYYLRPEPEVHSWKPYSRKDMRVTLEKLHAALVSHDEEEESDVDAIQLLIGELFWALFSEASTPDPLLQSPLHPFLQLSSGAPLLVTWLCNSLLKGTAESGFSFAPAQICRKRAVALIFGIKAYVLYRLAGRLHQQRPLSLPAAPVLCNPMDLAFMPMLQAGGVPGDAASNQLLSELSSTGTAFQLLVTAAATARQQQDAEDLKAESFCSLPQYLAHSYSGSVIFNESMHLAREVALAELEGAMAAILNGW